MSHLKTNLFKKIDLAQFKHTKSVLIFMKKFDILYPGRIIDQFFRENLFFKKNVGEKLIPTNTTVKIMFFL